MRSSRLTSTCSCGECRSGPGQTYRAVATRLPEGRGSLLGPFQVWGTRRDDPNDIVPHEHRRDLRGLSVFESWVNNASARAVGTQDILTTPWRRDANSSLPDRLHEVARQRRSRRSRSSRGKATSRCFPSFGAIGRNIAGMGIATPAWMKAKYPDLREVGRVRSQHIQSGESGRRTSRSRRSRIAFPTIRSGRPSRSWRSATMRFGPSSRPASTARRPRTGSRPRSSSDGTGLAGRFFAGVSYRSIASACPRDTLEFDDLGVTYGFSTARSYTIDWYGFDNAKDVVPRSHRHWPRDSGGCPGASPPESYVAARVSAGDADMQVDGVPPEAPYGFDVVGLDRMWPGKVIAIPPPPARADRRVFADLCPSSARAVRHLRRRATTAREAASSPSEEGFDRLTISEQTTFYGITHALMNSRLTDAQGASLGTALDRVRVDRADRGTVRRARRRRAVPALRHPEAGHPRRAGEEPGVLPGPREHGLSRGIPAFATDWSARNRTSRSPCRRTDCAPTSTWTIAPARHPQSMFNGHLTASNSDIRVGENSNKARRTVEWAHYLVAGVRDDWRKRCPTSPICSTSIAPMRRRRRYLPIGR